LLLIVLPPFLQLRLSPSFGLPRNLLLPLLFLPLAALLPALLYGGEKPLRLAIRGIFPQRRGKLPNGLFLVPLTV
jgi:hypothetical protein